MAVVAVAVLAVVASVVEACMYVESLAYDIFIRRVG